MVVFTLLIGSVVRAAICKWSPQHRLPLHEQVAASLKPQSGEFAVKISCGLLLREASTGE